jgi:peptidoglycan hydrolase CwlO-like protein
MKRTILIASLLLAAMGSLAGCVKVDAHAENIGWGSPPPAASIPQADPASKADLLRENQQLRQRVAWLDDQNRKLAKKSGELESDKREIQAEMAKIAAERDRYLRAAGR